jgi:hypothetical protein
MSDTPTIIDHVVDGVYIGGWRATKFPIELRASHVVHVLKLYPDEPLWPGDFTVLEHSIEDGAPISATQMQIGVEFISRNIDDGKRVLVQCGAGISRSSTFVLAYLLARDYDLRTAWALLRDCHPLANPHPQLWESLIANYGLRYTLQEVMHW